MNCIKKNEYNTSPDKVKQFVSKMVWVILDDPDPADVFSSVYLVLVYCEIN